MTALKYSIESFNSQMKESVNLKISLLKFSSQRIKKKKKKSEESIQDLCNTIKGSITDIMGIPEREEREKKGK